MPLFSSTYKINQYCRRVFQIETSYPAKLRNTIFLKILTWRWIPSDRLLRCPVAPAPASRRRPPDRRLSEVQRDEFHLFRTVEYHVGEIFLHQNANSAERHSRHDCQSS